ncbi:hypothetical protein BT63DRAFT_427588 [Microthyrium microscopicum]|uniref:J domain-containing protein n=1 Tax=Microthyrium microscopicum TaxID=703497 RepID=A0A6A6U4G9_9PEZI|nr:hypothetical protein BT63DRAFT_427588 [Microthyrium microscopicum]
MLLKALTRPSLPTTILKASNNHHYATLNPPSDHWPRTNSPQTHPTPYEILAISPTAPYTRAPFNALVKLYHPDRHGHPPTHISAHLSASQRLDRYRLIVAAHALLSDPEKRALYDTCGAGWLSDPSSLLARSAAATRANGTARNATWEDWEAWRTSREKPPEPQYMSNGAFVLLLASLTLGAAAAQGLHAESATHRRAIVREEKHWQANQAWVAAQTKAKMTGREKRIEEFVRTKDPGVLKSKGLMGLVMEPDLCESGDEMGRMRELDMKRKFVNKEI